MAKAGKRIAFNIINILGYYSLGNRKLRHSSINFFKSPARELIPFNIQSLKIKYLAWLRGDTPARESPNT